MRLLCGVVGWYVGCGSGSGCYNCERPLAWAAYCGTISVQGTAHSLSLAAVLQAAERLGGVQQEVAILRHAAAMPEEERQRQREARQAPGPPPDLLRQLHAAAGSLSSAAAQRQRVGEGVFKPSHVLPTMSVEQFGEVEYARWGWGGRWGGSICRMVAVACRVMVYSGCARPRASVCFDQLGKRRVCERRRLLPALPRPQDGGAAAAGGPGQGAAGQGGGGEERGAAGGGGAAQGGARG